jgi:uncharacterized protein YecT (DUF1311 family)
MKSITVFAVLLLASHFAHCADKTERPRCNANGSTQESNACVYDELDAADLELNKMYQSKLSSLPKSAQDALRADQRKWLQARDPQCKEDTRDMEGTTGWVSEFYGCVAAATKERTQQLKTWKAR